VVLVTPKPGCPVRSGLRPAYRAILLAFTAAVCAAVAAGASSPGAFARSSVQPSEGLSWAISGNVTASLWPGNPASPIDLQFSNPNDDSVAATAVTVAIASVAAPNATASLPCSSSDFALTQFTGSFPLAIPPGSSTLQSLGFAQSTWPTLRMVDTAQNQAGCSGATVKLSYSGTAKDGPAGSSLSIAIAPAKQTVHKHGRASFTVTVTNSGSGSLGAVTVSDLLAPGCGRVVGSLAAGGSQSWSCAREDVLQSFSDVASASGRDAGGVAVFASASAVVTVSAPFVPPVRFGITLHASPGKQKLTTRVRIHRQGGASVVSISYPTAHFRIRIRNTSSGRLTGLKVVDALAPGCNRTLAPIGPGGARGYDCQALAVTGSFENVAIVTGKGADGAKVTSRDTSIVKVVRSAVGAKASGKAAKSSAGVTVTRAKNGSGTTVTLSLPGLLFPTGSYALPPVAQRSLARVIQLLTVKYGHGPITVTGYTDNSGSAALNLELSRERATTVAAWLEAHSIPASRITVAWKGEADPVASNATPSGRALNRRVTITVRTGG